MIQKILWLDDIRDPDDFTVFKDYKCDITWVKTYEKAIQRMTTESFDTVSLDNDLGTIKEGIDVFNWIDEHLYFNDIQILNNIKTIFIHSSNVEARRYMLSARSNFYEKYGVLVTIFPTRYKRV